MADAFLDALLAEVRSAVQTWLDTGAHGHIDLLRLPMPPERIEALRERLGQGEIAMTLEAEGTSHIRETAFAGVWWIDHHDRAGHLVARLIEIGPVPQIVPADADAMRAALDALDALADCNAREAK